MTDEFVSFFEEFRRTVRIVDAMDILLVSIFLYTGLIWFKQTASRGVLVGVAALAVVYFAARALDMYLTSLAFHTTFAVLLFMLVVVFQEDLRRLFEHVSALHAVPFRQSASVNLDLDGLVEATFKLAASKTGALMVIKGAEPLHRHLESGIPLGGRLSRPLLYSIFDPSSPGHDGAVIIENDQIAQFGAHLPISKNRQEISGRGTRHSAALGLSERSDAVTIVVSEERGVVSVAERGKLRPVKSPPALKSRLEHFLATTFPSAEQSAWKRFVIQHGFLKLFAIVLAVVAWFVLAYDPHTIQRTFVVPIEYRNLAKELLLDERAPNEARVTLSGSERNFRFLEPGSLKISADLTASQVGVEEIPVTEKAMRVPANLTIYRIEPRIIRLYLRERPPPESDSTAERPVGSKANG